MADDGSILTRRFVKTGFSGIPGAIDSRELARTAQSRRDFALNFLTGSSPGRPGTTLPGADEDEDFGADLEAAIASNDSAFLRENAERIKSYAGRQQQVQQNAQRNYQDSTALQRSLGGNVSAGVSHTLPDKPPAWQTAMQRLTTSQPGGVPVGQVPGQVNISSTAQMDKRHAPLLFDNRERLKPMPRYYLNADSAGNPKY